MRPQHHPVSLTDEQRSQLEKMLHSGSWPARTLTKARILLLADCSGPHSVCDDEIARHLGICDKTCATTRNRFMEGGLEAALYDKHRPGKSPKLTGDLEARLVTLACSDAPEGHARWTVRLLADRMVELGYIDALSYVSVHRTLKKMNSSRGGSKAGVSAPPRRST